MWWQITLAAWLLLLGTAPMVAAQAKPEQMVGANFTFRTSSAMCSATLFDKVERWALTNYHCIEDAVRTVEREEVQPDGTVKKVTRVYYDEVTLSQTAYGTTGKVGELILRAEILAFHRQIDLAVLRILSETTPLLYAAAFPPGGYKLVQGQRVYAIGNPLDLENTITDGVISHLYREHRWSTDRVARYIQTDAMITSGSSGGAIYDAEQGYLIGIPSAGYRGVAINFAIPFDIVKEFLADNGFARTWDPKAPTREEWLETQKKKAEEKREK